MTDDPDATDPDQPDRPGRPEQPEQLGDDEAPSGPVAHDDDGLDLARSIAAATAAAAPGLRRRTRRQAPRATGTRLSGSHPDDRDPQLLGSEVERLVGEQGWALALRMRGVFARWAELVGAEVADHCTPESFTDGRLVVRTDSTAWATQLRLLAPTLVARLNDGLGPGTVTVVDVQGPQVPSWRRGPRTTRGGRGPRDTYG